MEVVAAAAGGVFYMLMNYWANQNALRSPIVQDVVFLYSPFAWILVHVILYGSFVACACSRPDVRLLTRRLLVGYALKAVIQFVTIVPQPRALGGAEACRDVPMWTLIGCADMMFSGHTMCTMMVLYKYKYRGFVVFAMGYQLVFAKMHYMSDVLVAVLATTAVESWTI